MPGGRAAVNGTQPPSSPAEQARHPRRAPPQRATLAHRAPRILISPRCRLFPLSWHFMAARGGVDLAPDNAGSGSGNEPATRERAIACGAGCPEYGRPGERRSIADDCWAAAQTPGVKRGEGYVGRWLPRARPHRTVRSPTRSRLWEVDTTTLGRDYTVITVEDLRGHGGATATRTVHVVDDVDGGWDDDGHFGLHVPRRLRCGKPPEGAWSGPELYLDHPLRPAAFLAQRERLLLPVRG